VGEYEAGAWIIQAPASSGVGSDEHEVGEEVRKTPTAPTAPTAHTSKPKKTRKTADLVPSIRGRYQGLRAIKSPARAMKVDYTDRTKIPQMSVLPMMRSMRAVFCRTLRQKIFQSNVPVSYGGRPPHIHVRVRAPGYEELVTQHYPERRQRKANFDLVLVAD
jgi:hypothetical protein